MTGQASASSPVERFGERLARLFASAGGPTYAAVVRGAERMAGGRTSVSVQRVSDWRKGKHLPADFGAIEPVLVWLTLQARGRGAVDVPSIEDWRRWWTAARAPAVRESVPCGVVDVVNPFVGLAAMTADDSAVYFGRDDVIRRLLQLVAAADAERAETAAIVLVTGVSGAGKSSLLGAGLARGLAGRPGWVVHRARPEPPSAERLGLPPDVERGADLTVIVVDQYEDIVHSPAWSAAERARLTERVAELAGQPGVVVVFGARADVFEEVAADPVLATALEHRCLVVQEMSDAQLREVVVGPARAAGVQVEAGLPDAIVDDVNAGVAPGSRAGRLPLLAHVLQGTWVRRKKARLTLADYRAAGGVSSALAESGERAWQRLGEARHGLGEAFLLSLVRVAPDGAATRVAATRADLRSRFPDTGELDAVIDTFADARLITVAEDTVELVHDVVLTAWPRLAALIERDRRIAPRLHRVTDDAGAWRHAGRRTDLLYSAGRYEQARELLERPYLPADVTAFMAASRERMVRAVRLRRASFAGVVVIAVVLTVLSVVMFRQKQSSDAQRDDARFTSIVELAGRLQASDPTLAAQFALAAFRQRPGDLDAQVQVVRTQSSPLATATPAHDGPIYDLAYAAPRHLLATASYDGTVKLWNVADPERPQAYAQALTGHRGFVTSVAFAPDGVTLATAGSDRTIRLWDTTDPDRPRPMQTLTPPGESGVGYILRFAASGTLVSTHDSGSVVVWVRGGDGYRPAATIPAGGPVRTVAVARSGGWMVVGSDDRSVTMWNIADPEQPSRIAALPTRFTSGAHSVAISDDGRLVAAGSDDGTAQVWDVGGGGGTPQPGSEPRQVGRSLFGHNAPIWSVVFSPDGSTLLTSGFDGTARRWDLTRPDVGITEYGQPLRTTRGALIAAVYESPERVFTVGAGGEIATWDLPGTDLPAHGDKITRPAVGGDGRLLATGAADKRVILWNIAEPTRPRRLAEITLPEVSTGGTYPWLSADGRLLVVGMSSGRRVYLYDIAAPERPRLLGRPLEVGTRFTNVAQLTPDGRTLVTGFDDTSLQLWDVADPARPVSLGPPLTGPRGFINEVQFSADGRTLYAASADHLVHRWRIAERNGVPPVSPAPLRGHAAAVSELAVSPDGRHLYSVGEDRALKVWDVGAEDDAAAADPADSEPMAADTVPLLGRAASVAVSTDGGLLAAATDQSVDVWGLADPASPRRLGSQSLSPSVAASQRLTFVSPSLLFAGGRQSLRWWNLRPEDQTERICRVSGGELTREVWEQYLPDVAYVAPCG